MRMRHKVTSFFCNVTHNNEPQKEEHSRHPIHDFKFIYVLASSIHYGCIIISAMIWYQLLD